MNNLIKDILDGLAPKYEATIDYTGGKFALVTKTVILCKTNERLAFKAAVRTQMQNGNFSERTTSTSTGSVDPLEFVINDATTNHYRLVFKPATAGGSGAGSRVTDVGEAFQCYALAARQAIGSDIEKLSDIKMLENKVKDTTDCPKVPLNDCLKEVNEGWSHSGEMIANQMYRDGVFSSTKKYSFLHQSPLVDAIYDCFRAAIKISEPGLRMKDDKWNPADIWCVDVNEANHLKRKFMPSKFPDGIAQLNGYILNLYKDKILIPVSLKKYDSGKVKGSVLNDGENFVAGDFEFTGFRNHTADKFDTQDVFIEFTRENKKGKVKGEIQFRAFGSGHQGNITKIGGSTTSAVHGKVGVYETFFMNALKREAVFDSDFIPKAHEKDLNKAAKNKNYKFGNIDYYVIAEFISDYTGVNRDKAYHMIDNYNGPAFHSSFLGIQLVHYFNKLSTSGQKDLLTKLATYGMSQVPGISCVHAKYE